MLCKKIKKLIEKSDVVSFDLFDTLVVRKVSKPKDIFKLLDIWCKNRFHLDGFYEDRINAEIIATNQNGGNVSLEDIYNNFTSKYDNKILKILINKEIDLEKKCIAPKKEGKEIFDYAKNLKKIVVLSSDMYLPKNVLIDICFKCGYSFSEYFVSGTLKKSKAKGDMFQYLCDQYRNKKILHIGDNFKSDYLNPKKFKIKSYFLKNKIKIHSDNVFDGVIKKLREIREPKNELSNFGYNYFGPFLLGFVKWIEFNVPTECNQVLFLSRDGQIIKEIFDLVNNRHNLHSHYFYASRKALIIPKLSFDSEYRNIFDSFYFNKQESFKNIIKKINMYTPEVEKKLVNSHIDYLSFYNINYLKDNEDFANFYNKNIKQNVELESKKQFEFLSDYFQTTTANCTNVSIVDIGWFGNMQKALEYLFPKNNFTGFYTGTFSDSENHNGFAFDKKTSLKYFYKEHFFNAFFEMLFSANHGSVLKYKKQGNKIIPVLKDFDSKSYEIIYEIQKNAILFVNDILSVVGKENLTCFKSRTFFDIFDYCENCKIEFIKSIGELLFEDGDDNKLIYSSKNDNISRKLAVKKSSWKIATIKVNYNISLGRIVSRLYSLYYKFKRK